MLYLKNLWNHPQVPKHIVLKSFHNNKKIPCIPAILHENSFVSNFKEKAELFNSFFAKQCSIIDNGSEIPSFLHPKTDKSLPNITFTEKDRKGYTKFKFK